jgi:CRISPR-associated protein Csb2
MLALGIRYLQGIAVGSHGEYGRVEWPPHPARVFMAMVAAHYQTGGCATERAALLWLEALRDSPEIHAPDAEPCHAVTQFVPINDKAGPSKALLHSLPVTRDRQPRTFARASLASDTVVLRWPDAEPTPEVRAALADLCGKVTRIGHSISLVQMWLADAIPAGLNRWIVDEKRGTHLLRVPKAGTLEELDRSFNGEALSRYVSLLLAIEDAPTKKVATAAKRNLAVASPAGEPLQQRPRVSTYACYSKAEELYETSEATGSVFSPHLAVFTLEREDGPYRQLDLACTLAVMDRWREAIASHANALQPETQCLLTGHSEGGGPLQKAHVAFLPLGFVGHPHADGRMAGVALALPKEMPPDVRADVLRATAGICKEGLKIGRLGAWKLTASTMARPLETLCPATWTAHPEGEARWSTVTPVAYDQHPKAKAKAEYLAEVAAMIATGCERIGLPRPREVIPTPVSVHLGAPPAHAFPRLHRKDGSERRHTHAILVFDEPVRGPVLIGAGRYRGYGLCRPISAGEKAG